MKRVAIVTGSASGIGNAVLTRLAADGYAVVGCSRRPLGDAERAALDAISADWRYVSADISTDEGQKSVIDAAYDSFGRLDVLVNNAGVAPVERRDLLEMTAQSFDRLISINLRGAFFLTQYAARRMTAEPRESNAFRAIIFVTSISADTVSLNRGEYCVSKSALSMTAKLYAERLAAEGINVYELRPGIVDTDMIKTVRDKYETMLEGGLAPLGRMGKPGDIAEAVSALAGGALRYSTGEIINIDGGMHIPKL